MHTATHGGSDPAVGGSRGTGSCSQPARRAGTGSSSPNAATRTARSWWSGRSPRAGPSTIDGMAFASEPPLLLLGVRRSGTTLLRVMLDGNPELAIPDESYFIPQLVARHPGPIDADEFIDDLRRLRTLREWELPVEAVRQRVRDGMSAGEAVAAIYQAYAERHGKRRWGDKTPMYMQHLPLLERLFPDALYVHLIRDGRDAALSFLAMPAGVVTRTWAHPRSAADFACQWRLEVAAAQALGRRAGERYLELRSEALVGDPEGVLRSICGLAA